MNYIVTGLICSGKSTFLKIAEKRNFKILKSDDLVSKYYNDINVIDDLKIKLKISSFEDNPKLIIKNLFLESDNNRKIVESIFHPIIHSIINKELSSNENLMVEVPAIMSNKELINNNESIFIETSYINRLNYFKSKNNNELKFFERMNEYQKDYLSIKSCCNIIINNNNEINNFYKHFDESRIKS